MPIEEVVRLNKRAYDGLDSAIGHGPAGKSLVELIDTLQEKANEKIGVINAITEENTDIEIPIDILAGVADAGTWTKAITSAGVVTITRTAGAATEGFWAALDEAIRAATGKGLKITGAKVVYSVNTADATDVRLEMYRTSIPANGSAPAAPTLIGGDQNAHYDTDHNTAAERGLDTGAPQNHTATVTFPSPAYAATGQSYRVKFVVVDPGTSVVILKGITLLASETWNDEE